MMYMDQSGVASIPGPSNYQDNSALVPHDSQPQGKKISLRLIIFYPVFNISMASKKSLVIDKLFL